MYKCILTKIKSTHNNLRTDTIEGIAPNLPQKETCFYLYGQGLEFGTRLIATSLVKEIINRTDESIDFETQNSTYNLKIISLDGDNQTVKD